MGLDFIRRMAAAHPERRLRSAFARRQAGDRVALLSESRPEWTLSDAGCVFAGAIDVPIYPTLTPTQVRYILKDSGALVLIVSNEEKFREVRRAFRVVPRWSTSSH